MTGDLDSMREYSYDNWDLEGALPILLATIETARPFVEMAPDCDIAPAADGAVCIEWRFPQVEIWADFERDGSVRMLEIYADRSLKAEQYFAPGNPEMSRFLQSILMAAITATRPAAEGLNR